MVGYVRRISGEYLLVSKFASAVARSLIMMMHLVMHRVVGVSYNLVSVVEAARTAMRIRKRLHHNRWRLVVIVVHVGLASLVMMIVLRVVVWGGGRVQCLTLSVVGHFWIYFSQNSAIGVRCYLILIKMIVGHGSLLQWRIKHRFLILVTVDQCLWGHRAMIDQQTRRWFIFNLLNDFLGKRIRFEFTSTRLSRMQIVTSLLFDRFRGRVPALASRSVTVDHQWWCEESLTFFLHHHDVALNIFVTLQSLNVASQVRMCWGGPTSITTKTHRQL